MSDNNSNCVFYVLRQQCSVFTFLIQNDKILKYNSFILFAIRNYCPNNLRKFSLLLLSYNCYLRNSELIANSNSPNSFGFLHSTVYTTCLLFADKQVVVVMDDQDCNHMIRNLHEASWSHDVIFGKTELVLIISEGTDTTVDSHTVKRKQYLFLSSAVGS